MGHIITLGNGLVCGLLAFGSMKDGLRDTSEGRPSSKGIGSYSFPQEMMTTRKRYLLVGLGAALGVASVVNLGFFLFETLGRS